MSSSVFFKFKSQKEPSRVTFDGTGISVFELKREIITINRLGDGTDFDLAIYNEDTNEEYSDDTTIIPRSTSIIARRLPATKYGKGTAQRYVSGKMPVNALNSSRLEKPVAKPVPSTAQPSSIKPAESEEDRIAQMFAADAQQWEQQQQVMATATPVFRPGQAFKGKSGALAPVPNHPPPGGYICYRCGEKGHWIQQCPTNADPNFDNRPRVKRTTGIPRSFLKTVEKPAESDVDGAAVPSGVMVNAEGEFVVAEPDKASWEQFQAKAKISDAAKESSKAESKEIQDLGLECPIDKKLFVEPVKTPCCKKTYCLECITNALFDSDFVCPNCETAGTLIDDLIPDEEAIAKTKEYLQEKKDAVPADKPEQKSSPIITAEDSKDSKSVSSETGAEPANGLVPLVNEKKRAAEEELDSAPASKRGSKPSTPLPADSAIKAISSAEQSVPVPSTGIQAPQAQDLSNPMMPMMPNGMMNPMFGMPGMPGMPSMPGMPGMGNMMMPFPPVPFPQQGQFFGNMGQGQWDNNFGSTQGFGSMTGGYGQNMGYGGPGNFPNHMPDFSMQGNYQNPQHRVFNSAPQNSEDNAYFRAPVNPQRHQTKQRRVRPSDYRELG